MRYISGSYYYCDEYHAEKDGGISLSIWWIFDIRRVSLKGIYTVAIASFHQLKMTFLRQTMASVKVPSAQ